MSDMNTADLMTYERRVEAGIARHDRMRRELLEELTDEVMDEIDAGDHDDELANSVLIDTTNAVGIARREAMNLGRAFPHEKDMGAIINFRAQILDYAIDVAERRIARMEP